MNEAHSATVDEITTPSPGALAAEALALADPQLKVGANFAGRANQFSESVSRLMTSPHFTPKVAEEAAEIIKIDALTDSNNWQRFGIGGGTFFALMASIVTLVLFMRNAASSFIPVIPAALATIAFFVAGERLDHQQNRYAIAESILKVAAKRDSTRFIKLDNIYPINIIIRRETRLSALIALLGIFLASLATIIFGKL